MIQRIQTIYMMVAILATAGLYASSEDVEILGSNLVIKGAAVVSTVFSVIAIFSFKNRKKQILFNYLNILINALLTGLLVYWMLNLSGGIDFPEKGIEFVFSLISLIMFALANISIQKDEKLVKSVDRLR